MQKINLAKALMKNKFCLGYIYKFNNGKYGYQNDNDLGLDLDGLNCLSVVVRKLKIEGRFYVYQIRCGCDDDGSGATLSQVIALAKDTHSTIFDLTEKERKLVKKYYGY